ncbi:hypothetical protein [Nonomuraea sp. NPDC001023]|uniref:hypothetical protein n=1 Tax=unclassified Nonomuraea TaxID=2593643 RepID=UPI003318D9FA
MKPSHQPGEVVPAPTVPAEARAQLLRVTARGATTSDAAEQAGLTKLTAWRYLDLMRREGAVHLRPTADGSGAEWWKTTKNRRSS